MKKSLLIISAAMLLCSVGVPVRGAHDGWYVNELTPRFKTPHLDWGTQEKPLRAFFLIGPSGARDVLELAQRMNLDYDAFITAIYGRFSYGGDVYASALSGTSTYEKSEEIRRKASKEADVIVIGCANFAELPPDVQFRILRKVQNGTGLVIHHWLKIPFKKVYEKSLPLPDFLKEVSPGFDVEKKITAYQFGKGRVLWINYSDYTSQNALTQAFNQTGIRAPAAQENELVFFMRALQWAAGKDISVGTVKREGDVLKAPAGVRYRLRDEYNQVLSEGKTPENGTVDFAGYPNGTYFFDVIVPDKGCGVFTFNRTSSLGETKLEASSEFRRAKIPFTGTFSVEKPADRDLTLQLSLVDQPHGRIWEIRNIPFPAGTARVPFEFKNYRMPTEAGVLIATLKDGKGSALARADKTMFFPSDKLPDYYQLTFGGTSSLSSGIQMVDNLGFSAALSLKVGAPFCLKNQQSVPYLITVNLNSDKKKPTSLYIMDSEIKKKAEALDDLNIYDPAARALWEEYVRKRLGDTPNYSPILYSLGDENSMNKSAGYGPKGLIAFRKFVAKKYGTIDKLNRNWGTRYKSFEEVPHNPMEESLKNKRYVEWNDHIEYVERMFADLHHIAADIIRKADPHARIGLEGTFGGHDFEAMMEKLDWWGPYTNAVEDQVLRSLYPKAPRFVWSGYHGERASKTPYMCRYILLGSVNGNGWYSADMSADWLHSILAVDLSPSWPQPFIDELQRLRFGMAQTLNNNRFFDSGIGIWWSHVSLRSNKVDPRCVLPTSGIGSLIRFGNATGAGYEFVTSRTAAERLKKVKVLFLAGLNAISDKDAETILEFVKNGGTVIADFVPARLNENLAVRDTNPLAALFGNETLKTPGTYEVRPLEVEGFKASKALMNPARKPVEIVEYGKGRAILMNFDFTIVETSGDRTTPFFGFLADLVRKYGASIPFSHTSMDTVFRVRSGRNFTQYGLYNTRNGARDTLSIPEEKFIYEAGKGFVGKRASWDVVFSDVQPLRVFNAFDKEQAAPELKAPEAVNAGDNIVLAYANIPSGRTMVIRVAGPDGRDLPGRGVVVRSDSGSYSFGVPYNEEKGDWTFTVMDYETGLSAARKVTVK